MSLWTKLTGGGAKAVTSAAKDVADIVERWAPSDQARHEMHQDVQVAVSKSVAEARAFDPRTTSARAVAEYINVIVDAFQRLIRPGVTVWILGGVFGTWRIETSTIDPVVLTWGELVMGFWFGVRTITRDIPSLIKMLVELKRGRA